MRSKVVSIIPLIVTIATAFYLPGIIPRAYSTSEKLPISFSSKLNSDRPHGSSKKWYKEEVHLARDTLREYDMCDADDAHLLEKTKHLSTTGYFAD